MKCSMDSCGTNRCGNKIDEGINFVPLRKWMVLCLGVQSNSEWRMRMGFGTLNG